MLAVLALAAVLLWALWAAARLIRTLRYSFAGKTALITGGSRGLGLVLARQLVGHGANVAILARDPNELSRAASDLEKAGTGILTLQCDVLDSQQIDAAVQRAIARFGTIDVLINNAGIIEVGPLAHTKRADFEQAMGIHFWAPFEFTTQIVARMDRARGGRVVNISSIGGKIAAPHLAAYSTSKFALTGYSDATRAELAARNVRVTTVCPGLMRTGSHVNAKTKGQHDAEFAWFALAASTPLISMNAERAARKILAACRRGQPSVTLTFAARFAIVANAVAPNLFGYVMCIVNKLLPGPAESGGDEPRLGWDSRASAGLPEVLTRLSDRASARNNEQRPSVEPQ
jgi:NAD(P)-dependent dehydrogenase (short-subunit alcohol dehydrogenase family)